MVLQEFDSAPATEWLHKDTRCLCSSEAGYGINPSALELAPKCFAHPEEAHIEAQAGIHTFDNDVDVINGHWS
jgi:hypothetical protein